MVTKKRNVISINLKDKAMLSLQIMGYMNGRKNATGKNISDFVSRLIIDFVGIHYPDDSRRVDERLLMIRMNELENQRKKVELDMRETAGKLQEVRDSK